VLALAGRKFATSADVGTCSHFIISLGLSTVAEGAGMALGARPPLVGRCKPRRDCDPAYAARLQAGALTASAAPAMVRAYECCSIWPSCPRMGQAVLRCPQLGAIAPKDAFPGRKDGSAPSMAATALPGGLCAMLRAWGRHFVLGPKFSATKPVL
jgi:hypothetical protein